jgi:hypothetical protein
MEAMVLSVLFIVIVAFLYSLWSIDIKEEKKEMGKYFR